MWLIACAKVRETSGWKTFPIFLNTSILLRTTQDWHTSASNIRQNIVESCVILKNLISYFEKFLKFNCLYANSENVTHFSTIFCDICIWDQFSILGENWKFKNQYYLCQRHTGRFDSKFSHIFKSNTKFEHRFQIFSNIYCRIMHQSRILPPGPYFIVKLISMANFWSKNIFRKINIEDGYTRNVLL